MKIFRSDIMSKEARSRVMSKIRSRDTKCELALRRALRSAGITRYRKNVRISGFEVDVAFFHERVAVFCDSDFWHGRKDEFPKSNKAYWIPKLKRNMERDRLATEALRHVGWKVLRLWEEDILAQPRLAAEQVMGALRG